MSATTITAPTYEGIGIDFAVPSRPARDDSWTERATCATDPQPDRFVDLPPLRVRGRNNPDYDAALNDATKTCDTCPVRDHCFWSAIGMDARGVFAGTDEYDRADLRDLLGIATPAMIPAPENDEDARLREQSFTALRYARRGYSNNEIAQMMEVSAMTVSRLLSSDAEFSAEFAQATEKVAEENIAAAASTAALTQGSGSGKANSTMEIARACTTASEAKSVVKSVVKVTSGGSVTDEPRDLATGTLFQTADIFWANVDLVHTTAEGQRMALESKSYTTPGAQVDVVFGDDFDFDYGPAVEAGRAVLI